MAKEKLDMVGKVSVVETGVIWVSESVKAVGVTTAEGKDSDYL